MGLNILQLACIHSANDILNMIMELFTGDKETLKEMALHKELRGGNQAIHFASTTGNLYIMLKLINEFGADPMAVTNNGLTVMHCGA